MGHFSFPYRMRRVAVGFAIAIVALVIMVPLAACGGGSSTGTSGTSSGPVNLTIWSWVSGLDKSAALFTQTHPNIHITVENVGAGPPEYDKLFTAIKANNEPDMALMEYQYMPTFEATGALVDLSQYGANSVKDQFVPWTWSQCVLGNAVYMIPWDSGAMIMNYRADLFKKYNIPVPTTWAQYADAAARLHAADPNVYITDFPPKQPGEFMGYVWQAGGRLFSINGQSWNVSINSPQAQQVASYWQDLINKKLVKTDPDFTASWYHALGSGTLATWFSGPWGLSVLKSNAPQTAGKWSVAPTPQWQAGQSVDGNWGGGGNVVFKSSKHPQEAAEFVEWVASNQQSLTNVIQANTLYPADKAGLDNPFWNTPQPFFGNQVVGQVLKQESAEVNVNFQWGPTTNQVYNDIDDNFANAVNGRGTLMDALNAVQQSTVSFMKKQGFSVST
jgi:multiple sugar transport system substrate-binding protein